MPDHKDLSGIPTFECPLDIHVGEAPVYNSRSLDPNPFDVHTQSILHTVLICTEFYKNVATVQIDDRQSFVLIILAPRIRTPRCKGSAPCMVFKSSIEHTRLDLHLWLLRSSFQCIRESI